MPKTKTPADFLRHLQAQDKTLAQWCRENGFSHAMACRVVNGASIGRWGEARRIVKAMGLPLPDMRATRPAASHRQAEAAKAA